MNDRDRRIIDLLRKFRVLSRDHIAALVCSEVANPAYTAWRICNRLARDGYIIAIPQEHARPYLYMPNPPIINKRSSRIDHFLAIADLYLTLGCPDHYDVEPPFANGNGYRPDVYATIDGERVCIEIQRSHKSNRHIQAKVNGFIRTFYRGDHKARTLWIVSDRRYNVKIPERDARVFTIKHMPTR
jgi:hypothetical protein